MSEFDLNESTEVLERMKRTYYQRIAQIEIELDKRCDKAYAELNEDDNE